MKIKINDTIYPCTIRDIHADHTWDNRPSKAITIEMDAATAASLCVDEVAWSVVRAEGATAPLSGVKAPDLEQDMIDYSVAGTITDNRDGTVTVKMGKPTDAELLAIIMGGN